MTRDRPGAVVIGAGIAGLAAGIALRRAGFAVRVHERAPALEPRGAALSLWPNAVAALRMLDAAARIEAEAPPIHALAAADRAGRWIFGPIPVVPFDGCGAFLPTRALLQEALLDALGRGCIRFDSDGRTDRAVVDRSKQAALPVHGPRLLRGPARALLRVLPIALHRQAIVQTHHWPDEFTARAKSLAPCAFPA